jgi:DNA-binding transcriptional MerR regulator
MEKYSVKQLAKLAGVSIRTLHHYDEIGLLQPSVRSESGYRLYGEKELLRLQQILFYRELDFELKEIVEILDDPNYDLLEALQEQKQMLTAEYDRISQLLETIEKTINNVKGESMLSHEELYEGFSKEQISRYRNEATQKWGGAVHRSEKHLRAFSKEALQQLKAEAAANWKLLSSMSENVPSDPEVQKEIEHHYLIIRKFWGTENCKDSQLDAYAGLGELYVADGRYTVIDGKEKPKFAVFMKDAMRIFVDKRR